MSMVCGLDLHRQQITFDALETESGEVWRGGGGGAPPPQVPPRLCPGGGPPARGGPGGVAGASAALQVAGRSTPRVDATYPRRTVPAWRGRARGGDPFGDDSGAADGRRGDLDPSRSPTGAGRLLDARGHRRRGAVLEAGPAALRSSPTGVPGAGGSQLRHRRGGCPGGGGRGPPTLRWALFEAAMNASHRRSPDHAYYTTVKNRHDGKLAAIAVARQLARRCYHVLRNLDPDVVYAMAD